MEVGRKYKEKCKHLGTIRKWQVLRNYKKNGDTLELKGKGKPQALKGKWGYALAGTIRKTCIRIRKRQVPRNQVGHQACHGLAVVFRHQFTLGGKD